MLDLIGDEHDGNFVSLFFLGCKKYLIWMKKLIKQFLHLLGFVLFLCLI